MPGKRKKEITQETAEDGYRWIAGQNIQGVIELLYEKLRAYIAYITNVINFQNVPGRQTNERTDRQREIAST